MELVGQKLNSRKFKALMEMPLEMGRCWDVILSVR